VLPLADGALVLAGVGVVVGGGGLLVGGLFVGAYGLPAVAAVAGCVPGSVPSVSPSWQPATAHAPSNATETRYRFMLISRGAHVDAGTKLAP